MAATSPGSIIQQIWNGAVKDFNTAQTWIKTQVARVEAVLPGAAPIVKDLEQAASDGIGVLANAAHTYEPAFVTALEVAADAAIGSVTGPYAQPLNQMANNTIQDIVTRGEQALQAWALKVQGQMAENVASTMTAKPASPPAPPSPPATQ